MVSTSPSLKGFDLWPYETDWVDGWNVEMVVSIPQRVRSVAILRPYILWSGNPRF